MNRKPLYVLGLCLSIVYIFLTIVQLIYRIFPMNRVGPIGERSGLTGADWIWFMFHITVGICWFVLAIFNIKNIKKNKNK